MAEKLLSEKLCKRYAQDGNEEVVNFVLNEVENLFKRKGRKKISSTDLQTLERKIERNVRALRRTSDIKANPDSPRAVVLNKEKPGRVNYEELQQRVPFPLNNYLVFNEAMRYQHTKDEEAREKRERLRKEKIRQELERQVDEKRRSGTDAKEIEDNYAATVRKNYLEWQKNNEDEVRRNKQKNREIRARQEEDLKRRQDRRDRALKLKQAEEEKMIQRAKDELTKEAQRQRDQVRIQKEFMLKVRAENEKIKAIRQEEKRKAQEYDQRLQREYAAKLDEQERLRAETFAKMKEKSSNNQQMYIKATEDKVRYEQEMERKIREYHQAKIIADNDREEMAIALQEQAKRDMNARLAQQIADKKRVEQELEAENAKFVTKFREDARLAIEAEENARRARLRAAKATKEEILKQIHDKMYRTSDTDSSLMTEHEKKINLPKMLSFTKDPELVKAIGERLEKVTAAEEIKRAKRQGKGRKVEEDLIIY